MQKFTIIYPPTIDYEYMQQRPQRLMEQFARNGHQVLYMNKNQKNKEPRFAEPGLLIIYREDDIYQIEKKYPVIVWASWAKTHEWIDKLQPALSVYDCLDDFPEWRLYEKEIISKVDLVTATAESLYEKMSQEHQLVIRLKNGCEYEHFSHVEKAPSPIDWPLEDNIKTVGYVGALGNWVDYKLLYVIAEHYNLVIIGPNLTRNIFNHPNIYYLGLKDYKLLPSYLKMMDALIIPFLLNDITKATNPIKMYEYLSTGIPVISTNIPEAKMVSEVLVSDSHEGILQHIHDAFSGKYQSAQLIKARKQIGMENSWQHRYTKIYNHLKKVYQSKTQNN